MKICWRDRN